MNSSRSPLLFAIVLLLLPMLYVGSYLALVRPGAEMANLAIDSREPEQLYRFGGTAAEILFWPLEQADLRIRPGAWLLEWEMVPSPPSVPHFPATPTTDAFANNPGVELVEQILPGEPVIVHIRDWHLVPKELYGASEGLTGDALDKAHAQLVLQATAVHKSKLAILADQTEVWQEGLTEQNEAIAAAEIRSLMAFHTMLKRDGLTDPDHEQALLRLGAAAELILEGREIKLLPADDHDAHEAARPQDGKIDDAANRAREEAIVQRIVATGKTAVLVLGGDHDLTAAIKPTGWGYIRVMPKGYPE